MKMELMASNPATPQSMQAILAQLQREFIEHLPHKLSMLENLVTSLQGQTSDTPRFHELLREVHSLKGSGGTYGLHVISTICHQLEDFISQTASTSPTFTPEFPLACLRHIDLLYEVAEGAKAGQLDFSAILLQLHSLRDTLQSAPFSALVIENSRLTQQIIVELMREMHIQPTVVSDGYKGLFRALNEPYNLIVTSSELPILNGYALSGALRLSDSKNRKIPIVLISSDTSARDKSHRKTDPSHVIVKDTHLLDNLRATLKNIVRQTTERH